MNIIDELDLAFSEHKMDDFTKLRYIYLYVCKKFSYDTRFMFALPSMKEEIYEKELNIKNVEEYEIVCYTFAKILKDILEHYGYKSEIIREENRSKTPHTYLIVTLGYKKIKLDPTKKHDTSRVKMNIMTYDFDSAIDDPTFSDDLEDADNLMKRINYYRSNYDSSKLSNLLSSFSVYNSGIDPKIDFFNTFNAIVATVNMAKDLTRYDDIDYFFSYAIRKMKLNEERNIVKPATFFNKEDPTMKDIINIILIEYDPDMPIFYIMEKVGENYHIRTISNEEVLDKLSHYCNYVTDEYFKNAAMKTGYKLF